MTRRALYAVSASRETRQSAARAVSHANDELSVFTVAGGWIIVREPLKEAFERIALAEQQQSVVDRYAVPLKLPIPPDPPSIDSTDRREKNRTRLREE